MTDKKKKLSKFGDIFDRPPPKCNAPHPCHICSPPEKPALDCKLETHDLEGNKDVKPDKSKTEFHFSSNSTRRVSKDANSPVTCSERTSAEKRKLTDLHSNIPDPHHFTPPCLPKFSSSWQIIASHMHDSDKTITLSSDVEVVLPKMSMERNQILNLACAVLNDTNRAHHLMKLPAEVSIIAPVTEVYVYRSSDEVFIPKITLRTDGTCEDVRVFSFDIEDVHNPPHLYEVFETMDKSIYFTFQDKHTVCVHSGVSCGLVCVKYGRRRRKMLCSLTGELRHLHNDAELFLRLYMYHDELISENNTRDEPVMLGKPILPPVQLAVDFDDITSKDSGLLSVMTIILSIDREFENMWCHRCNELAEPLYPGLLDVHLSDVSEKLNTQPCLPFEIKWCLLQCHDKSLDGLNASIEVEFLVLRKPPKKTRLAFQLKREDLAGFVVD